MKQRLPDILLLLFFSFLFIGLFFPSYWFLDGELKMQQYILIVPVLCGGLIFCLFPFVKPVQVRLDVLSVWLGVIVWYFILRSFSSSVSGFELAYLLSFIVLFIFSRRSGVTIHKVIALVIVLGAFSQALYGIGQYFNLFRYPSDVKGSFDNAAGLAACLVIAIPFALYLYKDFKTYRLCIIPLLLTICMTIILSGSRAGMVSGGIILCIFLYHCFLRFFVRTRKVVLPFFIIALISAGVYLFYLKKDSATGRLLIWENCFHMFMDAPLWGLGKGAFIADYMLYQANYFKNNPDSIFSLLADNVQRPFNEYLLVLVEYGIVGILFLVVLVILLILYRPKGFNPYGMAIIAIGIFSCFSYPLRYPVVQCLMVYSLGQLSLLTPTLTRFEIRKGYVLNSCLAGMLLPGIFFIASSIQFELHWRELNRLCSLGKRQQVISQYEQLYEKGKENPFFLYNYGAELNRLKRYEESNRILKECENYFNDYDLQLLTGYNNMELARWDEAERCFLLASSMCPNRFVPLSELMKVYEKQGESSKMMIVAEQIHIKPVKIPSAKVDLIKKQAEEKLK